QMTANEEAQLKNYLQNIDPDDGNSSYVPENDAHPDYGPITFWDKREVIVSNKDVTPDGLAGPTTATLTFMYALTIEDAVVFVDPSTELDEKVIAALFMIPTPAKFGKPFFKQADDLGGAASVRRKGKKDGDTLKSKDTGNSINFGKYSTSIDNKVKVIGKVDLPDWIRDSFTNGNYKTVITEENIIFYRTYGGGAKANGSFVTTSPAGNRINSKINTALVPDWKNTREFEAVIEVPKGQILNIGKVEKQYTKTGALLKGDG